MPKDNILVTGGSGLLGSNVVQTGQACARHCAGWTLSSIRRLSAVPGRP